MTATVDVHHILAGLLRGEDGLILGREALKLHAGSEVMHAGGRDGQRGGIIQRGDGFALHLAVVPERTLHALPALEAALRAQQAVHHFVVCEVAAGSIVQAFGHLLLAFGT